MSSDKIYVCEETELDFNEVVLELKTQGYVKLGGMCKIASEMTTSGKSAYCITMYRPAKHTNG